MILYFSATGNGKYIAEQIAEKTDEKCMSIVDCICEDKYCFSNEKIFGMVVPTYFWRLPRIVAEYLGKLRIENCGYTFFLTSYGATTGEAGSMAKKIMAHNGQNFDAYYSVIMPDTWTPVFDLTNKNRVDKWLSDGKKQLKLVIGNIFSATGNGKYIAEQIAEKTDEKCMSIVDCICEDKYCFSNEKIFGMVVPTYFWRLPRIVAEYLGKLRIENCGYTFFLTSYGATTGEAGSMAKKIMAHNGQNFDAYYSVIMPDTWTPVFDLTNKNRVDKWLSDGKKQLKLVIGNIMSKRKGNFVDRKLYSRKPEL